MKQSVRITLIVATVLIGIGLLISIAGMAIVHFFFDGVTEDELVTNRIVIDGAFSSLQIKGVECDILLLPSTDGATAIVCKESDKVYHTARVTEGTLTVTRHDKRPWTERIVSFHAPMRVEIFLPAGEYRDLYASTVSGKIEVADDFSFEKTTLRSVSGDIKMAANSAYTLNITSTSGYIALYSEKIGSLSASSTSGKIFIQSQLSWEKNGKDVAVSNVSGDISISDLKCEQLSLSSVSGAIRLIDTYCQSLEIEQTSGDTELTDCDSERINITSTSGKVSGTLLSPTSFEVKTVSGKIKVPENSSGSLCRIETVSGDIAMDINWKKQLP